MTKNCPGTDVRERTGNCSHYLDSSSIDHRHLQCWGYQAAKTDSNSISVKRPQLFLPHSCIFGHSTPKRTGKWPLTLCIHFKIGLLLTKFRKTAARNATLAAEILPFIFLLHGTKWYLWTISSPIRKVLDYQSRVMYWIQEDSFVSFVGQADSFIVAHGPRCISFNSSS